MAESWLKMDTSRIRAKLEEVEREMDRATKVAASGAARAVASAAKRHTRTYQGGGNSVHVRDVKKARRAGVNLLGAKLGKGESVEGANQVVAGLLKDSIRGGKVRQVGDHYSVKVGPFGPRTHLYARKIEALDYFMAKGLAESPAAVRKAYVKAWAKVLGG